MNFRKFGIPVLALVGLIFAGYMVALGMKRPPVPPIDHPPPVPPYTHSVAGSGIIEASSLNINIGTALVGLIEEVFVCPGMCVDKGAPLFRIDTRDLRAIEKQAEQSRDVAVARLNRLMSLPRKEEVPPLEAVVNRSNARLADQYSQYSLFENVSDKRAISYDAFNQRKFAAQVAKYELEQAKSNLELLKAGAWIEDLKIASQQVEEATARLGVAQTEVERATVRAPFSGQVMQVNVNLGDIARGALEDSAFGDPLMVFGAIDPLHVRVDVDEDDAWRIFPGAPAMAYVRGNSEIKFPLEFVRIDPFMIPKRSLTGENLERVDTRVLQLIYRFDKKNLPIYLGQLLDIYIEGKPSQGL